MNNGYWQSQNGPQGQQQGGYYPPPVNDSAGNSAQLFGILAVVGLFVCQVLSIIFGAIALSNAKQSRMILGFESSPAKIGRICGIIGIVFGILAILAVVLVYVFVFIMMISF